MLTQDKKAGILIDIIKDDRGEVRFQEEKCYNVVTSVTIASFAITAFLMGDKTLLHASRFGLILLPSMDFGLLVILGLLLGRLQQSLNTGQAFLQRRQQLLENVFARTADQAWS
jgi:hypothetical protein